jgi:hypothetical protein
MFIFLLPLLTHATPECGLGDRIYAPFEGGVGTDMVAYIIKEDTDTFTVVLGTLYIDTQLAHQVGLLAELLYCPWDQ